MFFYNELDAEASQNDPGTSDSHFNNVSLLLKMDSDFSDSSNNNLTVNTYGNATISTTESKYGGGSAYFDGSGDYALIPSDTAYAMDTQDFTIEFWYQPLAFANNPGALVNYANTWTTNRWAIHAPHVGFGSGFSFWVNNYSNNSPILQQTSALQVGVWTHLALTRKGNTWQMFINGVLEASNNSSISLDGGIGGDGLYIGVNFVNGLQRYANAYIDDLRITKGVARYSFNFDPPGAHTTTEQYYNNVSLLLSLDSDFSDSSINNINVTTAGNTTISSADSKYGGASAYLDGSGDGIVVTDSSFANFGTDDFTIETWVNMTSDAGQGVIFEARSAQAYELIWYIDPATNKLGFIPNNHGTTRLTSVNTISRNTWHHLVVTRENGTVSFFIDGVKDLATAYYPNSIYQTRTDVRIGQLVDNGFTTGFKGYIDDFRVTKGVARYTANFTPPDSLPTS